MSTLGDGQAGDSQQGESFAEGASEAEDAPVEPNNPVGIMGKAPTTEPAEAGWEQSPDYKRVSWITVAVFVVTFIAALAIGLVQYLQYHKDETDLEALYAKSSPATQQYYDKQAASNSAEAALSSAKQKLEEARQVSSSDVEKIQTLQNEVAAEQSAYDAIQKDLDALQGPYDKAQSDVYQFENSLTEPFVRIVVSIVLIAIAFGIALLVVVAIRSESKRAWQNRKLVASIPQSNDLSPIARWKDNEDRLRYYHQLVQNYSTSTRQLTLIVILAEFVFLLAIGAAFMFITVTSTAIAASIVAAVFAGVTGFVANVVLKNAEGSSREVRQFFRHPIDVQRLLSAQLIVDEMDGEEKNLARMAIVQSLTDNGPTPPGDDSAK